MSNSARDQGEHSVIGGLAGFLIFLALIIVYLVNHDNDFDKAFGISKPNTLSEVTVPVLYDLGEKVYYYAGDGSYTLSEIQGYVAVPRSASSINGTPLFDVKYVVQRINSGLIVFKEDSRIYTSLPVEGKKKSDLQRDDPVAEITFTETNRYTKGQRVFYGIQGDNSFKPTSIRGLLGYVYFSPTEQDILYRTGNSSNMFLLQSSILNEEDLPPTA